MLHKLLALPKTYIEFAVVRALLFFALFMGLGLFTLFMAAIMYLEWHWHMACILAVCLGPWLLAIIVLTILSIIYRVRFKRKKAALFCFNQNSLFFQVFSLALDYMLSRKRQ